MSLIERIYQLSDLKGDSIYKISKEIDVSNGYFAKTRSKNGSVGSDIVEKIVRYYPDVNTSWLILGEGEIFKTKNKENLTILNGKENGKENGNKRNVNKTLPFESDVVSESISIYKSIPQESLQKKGIPLIPIDAMAGFGEGSTQVMDYDAKVYVVPEFTELHVDFMIRVKGSSMYPKYNSGDLVACKKLFRDDVFFQWNKVYVLDTDQGALIKRVKKGIDKEHILLISDNETYDPIDLPWSKVFSIALVVGVIRLE